MNADITRRQMLGYSAATATAAVFGNHQLLHAAPIAKVVSTKVISHQPHLYNGWPTLTRRKNGQLLLVCSGGREAHVCPFGRVELMRSNDEGRTWSWPRILMDGPIDDRDAGILETDKGSILATTFTSLAFEPILQRAESAKSGSGGWAKDKLVRWQAARDRLNAEQRKRELGTWMIRSTDGGVTWSARYACPVDSPHGPIQLSDGRQMYAGKELWKDTHRIGACVSTDDGKTWSQLAQIPTRSGDNEKDYHELHAVDAGDGRIIAQIRNHNKNSFGETLQTESTDGGKTWSMPHSIGVWGFPSHLLKLKDGRLLMSYGHRRKPIGNQARVSADQGRTWSEPLTISADATSGDLGYPSTVQLEDGSLLTVWYEAMRGNRNAVLRQARWNLEG